MYGPRSRNHFEGVSDFTQRCGVVSLVSIDERCLQRRDVDGVSNWKVHRGVDHVPKGLFVVLNGAPFTITVSEEDQLLLLTCPQ